MIRKFSFFATAFCAGLLCVAPAVFGEKGNPAGKNGNIDLKSTRLGARVYVDDEYKGDADIFITNVSAGEHIITCRDGSDLVSGTFVIHENETLKLEARFEDGKILTVPEIEKMEAEKKKKEETAKPEVAEKRVEPKKPAPEKKKAAEHNPIEERRKLYLNVIKVNIEEKGQDEIAIAHTISQKVIREYTEKKNKAGKLHRNKKNMLMCEDGLCTQEWAASFSYVDEAGKSDAFQVKWRQTIYDHVTLTGVSKRELEWCVNGTCEKFEDPDTTGVPQRLEIGRYAVSWNKASITVRRADIKKDILDSGGDLSAY